jgi:hypothetical protein
MKNFETNLTCLMSMNSRAPELTFDTVGVRPQALRLFTTTWLTRPRNMAVRRMEPKFWGSVT